MSSRCPACGAPIHKKTYVDANGVFHHDGRFLKLSGRHARVLMTLLGDNLDEIVSRDRIRLALWRNRGFEEPPSWENAIRVGITNLRILLAGWDLSIESARGEGYCLFKPSTRRGVRATTQRTKVGYMQKTT